MEISLAKKNRISLNDESINKATYKVSYSIRNEVGEFVDDVEENDIEDKKALFDVKAEIFYAEFQVDPDSKGKDWRLVFTILDENGKYTTSDEAIVDLFVVKFENAVRLVNTTYFMDYILGGALDEGIKARLDNYPKRDIERALLASHGDLEDKIELSFTPKSIEDERHDWFADNIKQTYWMIQLFEWPVIDIQSYKLYYGREEVLELKEPLLSTTKQMGMVEYLPTSKDSPFFLVFHQTGMEASTISLFNRFMIGDRLPSVFHVSYRHGLDFMNLDETEQDKIKHAIARRGMFKILPRVSPEITKFQESSSVDGVSYSRGFKGLEWLNTEREDESEWVDAMKRKFNKQVKIITT